MTQRQQTDRQANQHAGQQANQETARQQASAALIERAATLVREVEFDMDRAARNWRRAKIDIRAATAKLSAAQEAEARRCFEDDLREADLCAADARTAPTSTPASYSMHAPMHAPLKSPTSAQRENDGPTGARSTAPRKMRNLV